MKALRVLAAVVGALALAIGLLWIGQGLGLILWPRSSFMLGAPVWSVNGAILSACGALAVWWGLRGRAPR